MKRILILTLALGLLAAACGSGDDTADGVATLEETQSTTTEVAAAADIDQEAAVIALVECLRDEGLDIADPQVDADGNVDMRSLFAQAENEQFDREAAQAALAQCESELDAVTVGFTEGIDFTQLQDELLVWAQCIRDNGFDMDDPDLSNFGELGEGGPAGGPFGDVDFEDPDFIAANAACEDLQPGFGPGGRTSGGGAPRP